MLVATLILFALLLMATTVALARGRRLAVTREAVVTLARAWAEDGSSRGRVCTAAAHAAGARWALLAEPTPRGDGLVLTAAAGAPELVGTTFDEGALPSAPLHVPDLEQAEDVAPILRRIGARSATVHPVVRGPNVVGVLLVGW